MRSEPSLLSLFKALLDLYGFQNWWPIDAEYHKLFGTNPMDEIIIGAVLTQNASWKNVEKALQNLKNLGHLSLEFVREVDIQRLKEIIRPAGFFNQKAATLKRVAQTLKPVEVVFSISREDLLSIKGVGRETADVILLYAANRPSFVVDKYTQRLVYRLYGIKGSYEQIKFLFESNVPKDLKLYKELHALIDEHSKRVCKKLPLCQNCALREMCVYANSWKGKSFRPTRSPGEHSPSS